MEYRNLGKSGLKVSAIGLGTNRFGAEHVPQSTVNDMMDAALDLGINFIDSADVYTGGQSETTLGKALKGRWDKFVLATKFFWSTGEGPDDRGGSRYHMLNAVEASLRRLQSDHILGDLAQAWLLAQPAVCSVISGATKLEQIQANVRAVEWTLSHAELEEVNALLKG